MTDDTPSKDDQFAPDEPSAHHSVTGRTGTGKTNRFISWHRAHRDESTDLIDPKAGHEDERTNESENA